MLRGWQPSTTAAKWESGTRNFGAADNPLDIGTGSSHKRAQRPLVTEINTPMYTPMGTDQIANSVGPSPRTLIDQTSEHNSVFKWTWLAAHLVLFIGFSYFSFSRSYGVLSFG